MAKVVGDGYTVQIEPLDTPTPTYTELCYGIAGQRPSMAAIRASRMQRLRLVRGGHEGSSPQLWR